MLRDRWLWVAVVTGAAAALILSLGYVWSADVDGDSGCKPRPKAEQPTCR